MEDHAVGTLLPEEPLLELQPFVHGQESICDSHLLNSGEYGVVLLADIKDVKYASKVVATTTKATFLS